MSSFLPPTFSFQASAHRNIFAEKEEKKKRKSTFPGAFFPVDCYSLAPIITASQLNQSSTVSKITASPSSSNQRDSMQRSKGETDTSLIGQGGIRL